MKTGVECRADSRLGYNCCLRPRSLNLAELVRKSESVHKERWSTRAFIEAGERIVHTICDAYEQGRARPNNFVSISSRQLMRLCGRESQGKPRKWRYIEVVEMLEFLGVIDANRRYSSGGAGFAQSFPKSFRLAAEYRRNLEPVTTLQERKCRTRPAVLKNPTADPIKRAWAEQCSKLRVEVEGLNRLLEAPCRSPRTRARIINSATKINRGDVQLCEGKKQKRIYTAVIQAPRALRELLVLDGEPLVEIDVKSCQPVLLLTVCPEEEREKLKALLAADFYALSPTERDKAKRDFYRFAFGAYKRWNALGDALQAHFPKLFATIRGFEGSFSAYLQNVEAEICVYAVGRRLLDARIFAAGLHDGYLVRRADVDVVRSIVQDEFAKRIPDFQVEVRVKQGSGAGS